jgi:hypothetical protein
MSISGTRAKNFEVKMVSTQPIAAENIAITVEPRGGRRVHAIRGGSVSGLTPEEWKFATENFPAFNKACLALGITKRTEVST